ncbi:hypothetical protein [Candidatus Palauibacter sp.]|uniref:hypothetical protein n=1 Tax=Candidatus Palauibacter sp. TaxID=3101350 RepID=UPI003B5A27C5
MKIRGKLVTGALAIVALMAVYLGAAPFAAKAQDEPQGLLSFEDFECPDECAPSAPVCCFHAPPIIVIID